ncbi:MAG: hypothetical protein JJU20_14875 [Opitutales bacterium]|nr:hypothetical protein [Opitutales bacterium]
MTQKLTSRERVRRAINREPHDRIPRYETFWEDTIQRWEKDGVSKARERALEELEADMAEVSSFFWPSPYPGRYEKSHETEDTIVLRDEWGGTFRQFKNQQTTPEHLGWECESPDIWRKEFRPRIEQFSDFLNPKPILEASRKGEQESKWRFSIGVEPFECLRKLIGDEATMINIIEEPEWIEEMAEVITSCNLRIFDRLYADGVRAEGLWIYGDMAFNHSTFCSPRQYREIIWPQHKRMCDWAHDHGMKLIYHSDGNVNAVVPDYIAAGIDVLHPMESKAGMDLRTLVPKHGANISFFGNIDVMKMIRGDEEELEEEIRLKLEAGKQKNGYIYHSDHSVPPQVSFPLYQKIISWVKKYGSYE